MSIICFDIGIRNLAWCCYNSDNKKILGWQNYDLINDADVISVKDKYTCLVCVKNALYEHDGKYYCTKHTIKPIFKDLSGNIYKKFPSVSILKTLLKTKGSKEELYTEVKKKYCIPIIKKNAIKKSFDIESLHDSIRKFVETNKELFLQTKHIGLENQPVLKNPTMKTVQILLYATLRDMLQPTPPKMHLIHALKKVKDQAAGDEGYKDRKKASVERANHFLKKNPQELKFHSIFNDSNKQNDLADALSMCLDFSSSRINTTA
jgi:hypothetical protein